MAPPTYARSHRRLQDPHAEFVQSFTRREHQNRVTKRPTPLTATQHATLRTQLQGVRFLKPAWADETKLNVAGILRKWKKYCEAVQLGPWQMAIQRADRATAMDFLYYICETGKIGSEGTSWEYYRQYKQLYASINGRYIDTNDNREILKFHDTALIPRFRLRPSNVNGKQVLNSDDLLVLQAFNIAYDTGIFPTERQRVQLLGAYLGLAYTGARPAELVDNEKQKPKDGSWEELFASSSSNAASDNDVAPDEDARVLDDLLSQETIGRGRPKALCYEDVNLMIVRHPDTDLDVLAMAVKFIHHKGADNKPKPTIFYFTMTRRVILCWITVILSLALCDNAFDAPSLTTAARVFQLKNLGPVKCTPLRWKQEWLKRPIFRRFEGTSVSKDEALQYHKLRDDLKRQSLDAGFEKAFEPRAFRRGAANAVNGKAPDAVRDQMMRHDPKWATFNSAYINEKVQFDIQNAFLDEPSEDSLIDLFTHVSLSRDPRARRDMVPDEVWETLPPDSDILEMERQREELKGGRYRYQGQDNEEMVRYLTREIRGKRAQRERDIRTQYREYYFYNRPTWDIERQALGREDPETEYCPPALEIQIPERAQLAEILCNQPATSNLEEMIELRAYICDLMVTLCQKRETTRRDRIRHRAAHQATPVAQELPDDQSFPLLMLKTQCPRCIGDNRLSYEERTFTYSRPAVMNDHFERAHLPEIKELQQDKLIFCEHPRCVEEGIKLQDLDHFRNHVQTVHGVWLRPRPAR